jgi:uncharacterized membrane protein
VAVVLGTLVLTNRKGTNLHKRIGYGYVVSMLVVNVTAFGLYQLTGRFGPFHLAAIVSLVSVLAGTLPLYFKAKFPSWKVLHFTYLYYSVIGLYAALCSEIIVRVPGIRFWWSIAIATFLTMLVGVVFFQSRRTSWLKEFSHQ